MTDTSTMVRPMTVAGYTFDAGQLWKFAQNKGLMNVPEKPDSSNIGSYGSDNGYATVRGKK